MYRNLGVPCMFFNNICPEADCISIQMLKNAFAFHIDVDRHILFVLKEVFVSFLLKYVQVHSTRKKLLVHLKNSFYNI